MSFETEFSKKINSMLVALVKEETEKMLGPEPEKPSAINKLQRLLAGATLEWYQWVLEFGPEDIDEVTETLKHLLTLLKALEEESD